MKHLLSVAVGCLAFSSVAVAQTATSRPGQMTARSPTGIELPSDEKAVLERLKHHNKMEVKWGELGRERASNPQVKQFAEMMVTDHGQANEKVMTYAKTRKWTLAEQPKPMNDTEKKGMAASKATMELMQTMQGPAFDSMFMANMVKSHDKTLLKLTAIQEKFSGTELARMANEMMPKISEHRDQAYRILGQIKPGGMATGGAGTEGTKGTQQQR
jgi:putative membrane protein